MWAFRVLLAAQLVAHGAAGVAALPPTTTTTPPAAALGSFAELSGDDQVCACAHCLAPLRR
jgi:hypothetical protein